MSVPEPGGAADSPPSTQAIAALVVGILGLISCWILSPIAWYLGSQELKSVRQARSPVAGEALAKVAIVLGIVGTVLFILLGLTVLLFGFGIFAAVLQGLRGA